MNVSLTRTSDTTLGLPDRVEIAERRAARNLFSQAADKTCAGNKFDERNVWLAHCVQRNLLRPTGPNDRRVRRARFVVIRDATCPAILIEAGFLSNRSEEQRIRTPAYRDKLMQAIADGILEYKKSV